MDDTFAVFENIGDIILARIPHQKITQQTGQSLLTQTPASQSADKPPKIVLDLSNITFLGSIALTVLVVILKRISTAGGQLVIAGLTGPSRDVMAVTRLEKVFKFCDTVEQAVEAMQHA